MINLALVLLLTLTSAAYAGAPQRVTYQGTLRKAGAIYTGTVPMEFKVTNADGSVTYWTSGSTGVYVSGGLFRYPLGTPNEAQFAVIPWGTVSPYVRVIVDGAALPADPLYSAPYAMHAVTTEGSAGSFSLADGDLRISTTSGSRGIVFQDGSAQYTAAASGLWVTSGVDIYNSNAGNVGIGTAGPSQKLEVAGTAKATAFQGDGSAVTNITASNIAGGSFANSAYTFPNSLTISGSLGADLNVGGFKITNLADPAAAQDGATKSYVDALTGGGFPSAVLSATQTFTGLNGFSNQLTISSNLFVTGGRIGVGTSSPAQELEVVGTAKATAFQGEGAALTNITASNIAGGSFANSAYTFPNNVTISGSLGAALNAGGFKITNLADPAAAQDAATKNYVDDLTGGGLPSAVLSATQTFTGTNGFSNQLTISSNLFVTNGSVGIGTASPGDKLTVIGGVTIASSITLSGATNAIHFSNAGGYDFKIAQNSGNTLDFLTPEYQAAPAMVISNSGNVGVGAAAPNYRLHLQGSDGAGLMIEQTANDVATTNSYTRGLFIRSGNRAVDFGQAGSAYADTNYQNKAWITTTGKFGIGVGGGAPNNFVIDASGAVGIGTAGPAGKLNVSGGAGNPVDDAAYAGYLVGKFQNAAQAYLEIRNTADTQAGLLLKGTGFAGSQHFLVGLNNNSKLRIGYGTGITDSKDGSSGLTVQADGSVGIGTTNPGAKLEVAGDAKITGGLKPDYDSGWFAIATNGAVQTITLNHNLGTIPSHHQIYTATSTSPGWVRPVNSNSAGLGYTPPESLWFSATQITLTGCCNDWVVYCDVNNWCPAGVSSSYTGYMKVVVWR